MSDALTKDEAAELREAAFEELALTEHYCRCARMHLQVADDPVTVMDMLRARDHFTAAIRAFAPIRQAMQNRGAVGDQGRLRGAAA